MTLLLSVPLTLARPLTRIWALMPEPANAALVTAAACPTAALSAA